MPEAVDSSAIGFDKSFEHGEHRGFSGSGRSDDGRCRTGGHCEGDILEDRLVVIAEMDAVQNDCSAAGIRDLVDVLGAASAFAVSGQYLADSVVGGEAELDLRVGPHCLGHGHNKQEEVHDEGQELANGHGPVGYAEPTNGKNDEKSALDA